MSDIHPIFTKFSVPRNQESRYGSGEPWMLDGYLYATDGRVCVRMKRDAPNSDKSPVDVKSLPWDKSLYTNTPIPLPSHIDPPLPIKHCEECEGEGEVVDVICKECNGSGNIECDLGHTHYCGECDGQGKTTLAGPCFGCDGKGLMEQEYFPVEITDDVFIMDRYARPLRRYGAKLFLSFHPATGPRGRPTPLRFEIGDDIEGFVSTCRPPQEGRDC